MAIQSGFTNLISGKRDSKYQVPVLCILLPFIGVVVVLCSRSTTEVQCVICTTFRQSFATVGHRYRGAPRAPSTILSWIIHLIGAIPVPGPMQTTGVSGVGGRLSSPRCIPTRYVLRAVEGSSPASQVVQRPLRALLSFVLYLTIAMHSSIDLGCFCSAHVRDTLATRGGCRAHFDGTRDRELSGPHEWEEVEYVLLRHNGVSEVEQYFEDCSSWALNVFVHFILDLRISARSSRHSSRQSNLTLGTAKFFEFLFFHRIVCKVSQKFKERLSWNGREIESVPEEPAEGDSSAGHIFGHRLI